MKKDIESRADIQFFVDKFYGGMQSDDLVGHVFLEVERVDFSKHLPKMYDFWEMLLFDGRAYQGAPMQNHLRINAHHPLTAAHFERWLELFRATIDADFEGPKAEEAKSKAHHIAETWKYKFAHLNGEARA